VGQRRLKNAINQFQQEHGNDTKFTIRWKPFLLDPSTPKQGYNRERYFRNKFGVTNMQDFPMTKHLINAGAEEGIQFNMGKPDVISFSVDAHRLLNHVLKQNGPEKQDEIASEIFSKYFEQGVDVGKTQVLEEIAQQHNINLPKDFFHDEEELDQIIEEDANAKEQGISGVPFFILGSPSNSQRLSISGAQNASTFLQMLRKLLKK
jgi:predicted DsbA family dithiol-disulfide isomerase